MKYKVGREDGLGHAGTGNRGNRVGENVLLLALNGQRVREACQKQISFGEGTETLAGRTIKAELGHGVVGLTEVAVDTSRRGGHDDATELLLLHEGPSSLGASIGTLAKKSHHHDASDTQQHHHYLDVDLVDEIPVLLGHLDEGGVPEDTSVVDKDVNTAKVVNGRLDDLVAVLDLNAST